MKEKVVAKIKMKNQNLFYHDGIYTLGSYGLVYIFVKNADNSHWIWIAYFMPIAII